MMEEPVDILARHLELLASDLAAALRRIDNLESRNDELTRRVLAKDEAFQRISRVLKPVPDIVAVTDRAVRIARHKHDPKTAARWAALKFA